MTRAIEKILSILTAGMIAVSPILYTGCDLENFGMTRQEHIRADCLKKWRNEQTRNYSQCVSVGYTAEREGR